MEVQDFIEELRRFPQSAKVMLCDKQVLIDVSPLVNSRGMSVLDVLCQDSELPDSLRKRCPQCGYTEDDARIHGDHRRCFGYPFFRGEQ